ncbi:galectin-9-like [Astyanax mexicanus]|uniref:Galectin n=1 Tax=Astyanax mexicanus TaxID=7994 RepID=A0A8T2KXZ6_ASTMX|nr:galectin-9-like [Astyanax mexicanus]
MAKENKLQKVLENLNAEDLASFRTHLVQGVVDNFPAVPECQLQDADLQATASQMVQVYGVKDAVKICETALRVMNHSYLAETLAGIKGSFRPGFPYEQVLYDGLRNQTVITIQGQVKPNADRFHINLHKDNDIAFHFNPRFNENGNQVIVRNSKRRYVWEAEERELCFFPFTPGKPFQLKILCTDSEYRVEVDKEHLLNFTHRIKEIHQIRKLTVKGDVFVQHVTIDPIPLWMTAPSAYILNDVISENMTITIPLHVKPNAKEFAIDVMKNEDILFHLKPYFFDDGKLCIVRNSLIDGFWGCEERETPSFPFARGKSFLLKILCTDKEFRVYVDRTHLLDFAYRGFDITKIDKVVICEDVIAWGVRVRPSRMC